MGKGQRNRGYVKEHILVAEEAVGHTLQTGAVVHHINEIKSDNRNMDLVVLQDHAEHAALHYRLRVLRAGGDPWTQRFCCGCHQLLDKSEFYRVKRDAGYHGECKQCSRARTRERNSRKRRSQEAA